MRTADRSRIDRLPTRAERGTGIVLSALLALVFLPAAIWVSVKVFEVDDGRATGVVLAAVLALIGLAGAFLFFRICFTEPRAASHRAQRIYAWIAIVVSVSLAVTMLVRLATSSNAKAPSNKSQERTREG